MSWSPLLIVLFTCHSVFAVFGRSDSLSFTVEENVGPETKIGNIKTELGKHRYDVGDSSEFEIVYTRQRDHLFKVNKNDGTIFTNKLIDREKLCEKKEECVVKLLVRYKNTKKEKKFIRLHIEIKDVNDNAPVFNPQKVQLRVTETGPNVLPDQRISLPAATDKDTAAYGVKRYTIQPSQEFSRRFSLIQPDKPTGIPQLRINQPLDREQRDKYSFKLVATDGGGREGTADIVITIQDVNDNAPEWQNKVMTAHVRECDKTNSAIVTLKATDKDIGKNGRIEYRISPSASNFIRNHFYIQDRTLLIHRELDYETHKEIKIPVEALDGGSSGLRLTSSASVNVLIEDCNDNAPFIKVRNEEERKNPVIVENSNTKEELALIIVRDVDSGKNGEVHCQLDKNLDEKFVLEIQISDPMTYALKQRVDYPFDRETEPRINVRILCTDNSNEGKRTSEKEFYVTIADQNDNAPIFERNPFKFSIAENLPQNTYVGTVRATDKDAGMNARLIYNISSKGSRHFTINKNGQLYTNMRFDREKVKLYKFMVFAMDQGKPSQTSSAQVYVDITDVNDCAPRFSTGMYMFTVDESYGKKARHKRLGQLKATDEDDKDNGTVTYKFQSGTSAKVRKRFLLTSTGSLSVEGVIDREVDEEYTFTVVASDKGIPPKTATSLVKVLVSDVNDNAPVFIFPAPRGSSKNITLPLPVGSSIAEIKATDADAGENKTITYYITNRRNSNDKATEYFKLDSHSGLLILSSPLKLDSKDRRNRWTLFLKAIDGGKKYSTATLQIQIINGLNSKGRQHIGDRGLPIEDNSNMTILYALAAIVFAVFIILFVILVLFYLRCCDCNKGPRKDRDTESHHYDAVNMPVQENQYQERQGKETLPLDASLLPRDTGCQKLADEYHTGDSGYTNLNTTQRVRSTSYGYIPVNMNEEGIYGTRTLRRGPRPDQDNTAMTPGSYEAFNLVGGGGDTRDGSETLKRHGPNIIADTPGTGKLVSTHSYTRLDSPSKTANRTDKGTIEPSPFTTLKSPYITTSFV